jgi:hypothetical protein
VSAALFRTGRRDKAVIENGAALKQLEQVQANPTIQTSIREDARRSLESGRNQLQDRKFATVSGNRLHCSLIVFLLLPLTRPSSAAGLYKKLIDIRSSRLQ